MTVDKKDAVDWNSPEAIAFFESEWKHACDQADQAINNALACDPLWSTLTDDKVGDVLLPYLGEQKYWLLFEFAQAVGLLSPVSLKSRVDQ